MNKTEVNIAIFSQSTSLNQLILLIQDCHNSLPFICVSTHKLYDAEEASVLETVQHPVYFACFADFLTDNEMAWCDTHAYEIESKENGSKLRTANQYYQYIKIEKNKLILKNISKQYQLVEKYLCSDDLGIVADVWIEEGFYNYVEQEQLAAEATPIAMTSRTRKDWFLQIIKNIRRIHNALNRPLAKVSVLKTPVGNYVFLGSITRIRPHLDNVDIQQLQPGLITNIINMLLIFILKPSNKLKKAILFRMQRRIISKYPTAQGISILLSTMHEYKLGYAELADSMNMDLVVLQDGFLPENYSSRYLDYYFGVREFWTWDRLSLGLFENQGFKAEVCSFFSIPKLPVIEKDQYAVKTISVLTSGAGDWTALKNRSDEDLMVMAFVEVAKKFPDINIIYRCHPLWAHKEHQGVDAINRVDQFFREKGIKNITVSSESLTLSKQFIEQKVLGFHHSSIEQDIEKADLVFGEHSFTMIDAARWGKLFASVNLTKRRDFFYSYSKLGFPHLESTGKLISFIVI